MKLRWFLGISLVVLLGFYIYWRMEGEKVRLVVCDVGQGDGLFISRGEFQLVYDVGPANRKMLECLGNQLPFWDKRLEVVIISHWDGDHSGGLAEISRSYKIEKLFSSQEKRQASGQNSYSGNLEKNDIIRSGEIEFEVLSPDSFLRETRKDDNGLSVVGLLSYRANRILLTGDIDMEVERRLVWRRELEKAKGGGLKVSHHGSGEGTSEEFLETVKPAWAVIGVGKNSFGHPTREVLDRLEKAGVAVWRTDKMGEMVREW
jgi:competence protein ComEC